MSLEHVSIWHENGWQRISANQADKIFSRTVKAHERMFICDLCHKHVIFVKGANVSHFKHNKGDPEKECADRTQALAQSAQQILHNTIANPIRIKVEANAINIEVGFLPMPSILLNKAEALNMQVCVCAGDKILITKNISNSNFSSEETVFYPIGNAYFDKYRLQVIPTAEAIHYPLLNREFPGLYSSGTLFDYQSGRKIPIDGDIEIGRQYYLLTEFDPDAPRHVSISKLMSDKSYMLYIVSAQIITKETTEFFFKFRCRLTAAPTKLIPVWPILHEGEHYIETNRQQMHFLLKGDSSIKIEPSYLLGFANTHRITNQGDAQLISIQNASRIRMLWAARLSVLRYLSLYYTDSERAFTNIDYEPALLYTDGQIPIENGIHSSLPEKNRLYITTKYDGKVVVHNRGGGLRYCSKIKADQTIMLEKITWGDSIKVYYGMDEVASLLFARSCEDHTTKDENFVKWLRSCHGRQIPFSHRYKWVLTRVANMPKSKAFIQDALHNGWIRSDALSALSNITKERNNDGN